MPAHHRLKTASGPRPTSLRNKKRRKRPFEIDLALSRIRAAVESFPKAALFELAADGFNTPFEQLAACIISIRTRDEVTVPTARRLFAEARTPSEVAGLSVRKIDCLIHTCSFSRGQGAAGS